MTFSNIKADSSFDQNYFAFKLSYILLLQKVIKQAVIFQEKICMLVAFYWIFVRSWLQNFATWDADLLHWFLLLDKSNSKLLSCCITKDRMPSHEYNKLAKGKLGPLEVLEKINPNAYVLQLPGHIHALIWNISAKLPYFQLLKLGFAIDCWDSFSYLIFRIHIESK